MGTFRLLRHASALGPARAQVDAQRVVEALGTESDTISRSEETKRQQQKKSMEMLIHFGAKTMGLVKTGDVISIQSTFGLCQD